VPARQACPPRKEFKIINLPTLTLPHIDTCQRLEEFGEEVRIPERWFYCL
jgi:hypothetical protein